MPSSIKSSVVVKKIVRINWKTSIGKIAFSKMQRHLFNHGGKR